MRSSSNSPGHRLTRSAGASRIVKSRSSLDRESSSVIRAGIRWDSLPRLHATILNGPRLAADTKGGL